jgi:hypothetical protein
MQEYSEQIQPYHAETDASAVFLLWQTALGRLWPIAFERFQRVLAAPHAQHFVARNDGQIIGFVATSRLPGNARAWAKRSMKRPSCICVQQARR